MTYDQYWKGDTMAAKAYREKYEIDRDNRNAEMWWQGLYNYEGHAVTLANAFKKKGAKAAQYPQEPYRIRPMTEAEAKAEQEKETQRIYNYFDSLIAAQKAQRAKANGN